jgi:hypothetical protein
MFSPLSAATSLLESGLTINPVVLKNQRNIEIFVYTFFVQDFKQTIV